MDPQRVFCPNSARPARGQVGQGNIHVHSQKDRRYRCDVCGKTFTETKGTPFYRLRTVEETVTIVITLLAHGCPLQAIVAAFGVDERTVQAWQQRAGQHCQQVHEHLVAQPRDLGQVQADEIRAKLQGGILWMAMAIQVPTRLWLGGVLGTTATAPPQGDLRSLIHGLAESQGDRRIKGAGAIFAHAGCMEDSDILRRGGDRRQAEGQDVR